MAIEKITADQFQSEVLESTLPVIVEFYADWCPPCKMAHPLLNLLALEYGDKVKVVEVDVDTDDELAESYGVQGIPQTLLFEAGKETERLKGLQRLATYRQMIEGALKRKRE